MGFTLTAAVNLHSALHLHLCSSIPTRVSHNPPPHARHNRTDILNPSDWHASAIPYSDTACEGG